MLSIKTLLAFNQAFMNNSTVLPVFVPRVTSPYLGWRLRLFISEVKGFIHTGIIHKIPGPFTGRLRSVGNQQRRTIKLFLLKICSSHGCIKLKIIYKQENNIKVILKKIRQAFQRLISQKQKRGCVPVIFEHGFISTNSIKQPFF